MAKNLFIIATEEKSGKSVIALGMMQLLLKNVRNVAFFRPLIADPPHPGARDTDINLILDQFDLDIPYEETYAFTFKEARKLINEGQHELLLDNILQKYRVLECKYDFILCECSDYTGKDAAFEFDLNTDIAANLSAPVLVVANAVLKAAPEIVASTQSTLDLLYEKGLNVVSCIINRSSVTEAEERHIAAALSFKDKTTPLLTYIVPEDPVLGKPTMADVKKGLNAKVLYGEDKLNFLVQDYLIAAMQIGNFLDYLTPDSVIITPGDRPDIALTALGSRSSSAYPDISGVILTGGLQLPESVHRLIKGWRHVPIPILEVQDNTFKTIQTVSFLNTTIEPDDVRKISTALNNFETYVDTNEVAKRIIDLRPTKITPKMFEFKLLERAASDKMRIVLPEGAEERILRATEVLVRRNVADIILLGDKNKIQEKMVGLGLDIQATIIQPELSPYFEDYALTYQQLRAKKGLSIEQARDVIVDPTYFGTMMVYKGDADGMVSGSINTTAHTIRPAFEFIKTKPGAAIVSSVFLMCLKDRVLAFGDCAVNPNPTPEQLADIAISSAQTAKLFHIEPKVAMLSYSTGESGKGADVDKVVEATRIAKALAPDLLLEGPLQYDAAFDAKVAATKAPDSKVAGQATVFIFPDLNTGNNTYKAVQRASSDVIAIGPVLQGLNKPVNDLSRGCTVADIVNTVAITSVQAQDEKARRAAEK